MSLDQGPVPWCAVYRSTDPSLNVGRSIPDGPTRLECEGVCFLGRTLHDERLGFSKSQIEFGASVKELMAEILLAPKGYAVLIMAVCRNMDEP
jgi:hypothetical protein